MLHLGTTVTRKETRALGETRNSRLSKGSLVFEVDESFGRINGKNSEGFITKGGCVMRKFASEDFQKISEKKRKNRSKNLVPPTSFSRSLARRVDESRREGKEVSEIEQYKMAHYSKKLKGMINEEADTIWNDLKVEEATSSCTSAEICLKKLGHLPGYIKGRSASTKQILETLCVLVTGVHWSPSSRTALPEAELEYEEGHISKSMCAIFKIASTPTKGRLLDEFVPKLYLAIWTTTPWTIPANAVVAVNSKLQYAIVEVQSCSQKVRDFVAAHMSSKGIELHTEESQAVIKSVDGSFSLKTNKGTTEGFSHVMFATGRKPNTKRSYGDSKVYSHISSTPMYKELIVVWPANIFILTKSLTATPHRNSSLSSYPNKRARQLVWDHPDSQDFNAIPSAVFFQPPIGQVGLGEQQVTGTIVAAITKSFLEMAR
ncbi:isoleucine--tRNA ligase, chloroplastic/mitochondrial-like protein [Tanacetum coccineum]